MARARIKLFIRHFAENGMKLLLEDPRNVRDLLATQALSVLKRIDFDRAKLDRTTYVQRDYRHLEADVVLRAPLLKSGKGKSARHITVYILIEHQSEPDRMMVFRVLEYVVQTAGYFGWVLELFQQRRARPAEFQDLLGRVVGHLEAMPSAERFRWLDLLSYIHALVYHERDWGEQSLLQADIEASVQTDEHRKEVYAMGKSYADVLMDRGIKKGRKEGIKEGELGALRRSLLNQLTKRFGKLPARTVAVIEATENVEKLDDWLERFATAGNLDEVGIG